MSLGVFSSYSGATLKFSQLSQCFGSREFSSSRRGKPWTHQGSPHPFFVSALLSRIYKQGEFKLEVPQAGAGAKGGDRREDGLLQVVTIQSAVGTDFRSENGRNSDRSIFNSKVSNIVLEKVLCFYTDKMIGNVVCLLTKGVCKIF